MSRYRKAIVAVIGASVLVASNVFGVEVGPEDAAAATSVVDAVIVLLTGLGVKEVRNEA